MLKKIVFGLLLTLLSKYSFAQFKNDYQLKKIAVKDTLVVDTLSILPHTLKLFDNQTLINSSSYSFNYVTATLIWKRKPITDSVIISYRTFPFLFTKKEFKK